jgi:hypothetical protein
MYETFLQQWLIPSLLVVVMVTSSRAQSVEDRVKVLEDLVKKVQGIQKVLSGQVMMTQLVQEERVR